MKNLIISTIGLFASVIPIVAQNPFDFGNVKLAQQGITDSLKTNPIATDWKNELDDASKAEKFTALLSNIAGIVIDRGWTFPSGGDWQIIEWGKVNTLDGLLKDQGNILETTNSIARNDRELAQICVIIEAQIASSQKMNLWYEDWLLNLARSSKNNLKWLLLVTSSGIAEDLSKEDNVARTIDWNKWEQAFNDSDTLGKSLLLVYMTELSVHSQNFEKTKSIHLQVFEENNDVLKAVAIFAGSPMLGEQVVSRWRAIENSSSNLKLKSLAREALIK